MFRIDDGRFDPSPESESGSPGDISDLVYKLAGQFEATAEKFEKLRKYLDSVDEAEFRRQINDLAFSGRENKKGKGIVVCAVYSDYPLGFSLGISNNFYYSKVIFLSSESENERDSKNDLLKVNAINGIIMYFLHNLSWHCLSRYSSRENIICEIGRQLNVLLDCACKIRRNILYPEVAEMESRLAEKEAKLIIIEEVIESAVIALDQTKKFFKSKKIAQIRFELIAMLSYERIEKLQKMGIVGGNINPSEPWPRLPSGYQPCHGNLDISKPPKCGSGVK